MPSFLTDLLLPGVAFVLWAVWLLLLKRRQAPARKARIGPLWWALATLACAGATAYLLSGLGHGNGWDGLVLMLLGLATGVMALHCLARCVFGLLQGVMGGGGGLPSQADAARQRALLRANSPRPAKPAAKSPSQSGPGSRPPTS